MTCEWLPEFYEYPDWNNYISFEKRLYSFFCSTYFSNLMYFNSKILKYRRFPIVEEREELYYHLTCCDYEKTGNRLPDAERIIRIEWTKAFVENYLCVNTCCVSKPMYWANNRDNRIRHKIFHNNFLVVIEERANYYLLITGHYIDKEYYRKDLRKEYEKHKIN